MDASDSSYGLATLSLSRAGAPSENRLRHGCPEFTSSYAHRSKGKSDRKTDFCIPESRGRSGDRKRDARPDLESVPSLVPVLVVDAVRRTDLWNSILSWEVVNSIISWTKEESSSRTQGQSQTRPDARAQASRPRDMYQKTDFERFH